MKKMIFLFSLSSLPLSLFGQELNVLCPLAPSNTNILSRLVVTGQSVAQVAQEEKFCKLSAEKRELDDLQICFCSTSQIEKQDKEEGKMAGLLREAVTLMKSCPQLFSEKSKDIIRSKGSIDNNDDGPFNLLNYALERALDRINWKYIVEDDASFKNKKKEFPRILCSMHEQATTSIPLKLKHYLNPDFNQTEKNQDEKIDSYAEKILFCSEGFLKIFARALKDDKEAQISKEKRFELFQKTINEKIQKHSFKDKLGSDSQMLFKYLPSLSPQNRQEDMDEYCMDLYKNIRCEKKDQECRDLQSKYCQQFWPTNLNSCKGMINSLLSKKDFAQKEEKEKKEVEEASKNVSEDKKQEHFISSSKVLSKLDKAVEEGRLEKDGTVSFDPKELSQMNYPRAAAKMTTEPSNASILPSKSIENLRDYINPPVVSQASPVAPAPVISAPVSSEVKSVSSESKTFVDKNNVLVDEEQEPLVKKSISKKKVEKIQKKNEDEEESLDEEEVQDETPIRKVPSSPKKVHEKLSDSKEASSVISSSSSSSNSNVKIPSYNEAKADPRKIPEEALARYVEAQKFEKEITAKQDFDPLFDGVVDISPPETGILLKAFNTGKIGNRDVTQIVLGDDIKDIKSLEKANTFHGAVVIAEDKNKHERYICRAFITDKEGVEKLLPVDAKAPSKDALAGYKCKTQKINSGDIKETKSKKVPPSKLTKEEKKQAQKALSGDERLYKAFVLDRIMKTK